MKQQAIIVAFSLFLAFSAPAPGADWDTLGLGEDGRSCARHNNGCVARIETRHGGVSLAVVDGKFRLFVNEAHIDTLEGYSIGIEGGYALGESDAVLISLNSGGMACPMSLYIIQLDGGSDYTLSPSFGTCSDYYKAYIDKGGLMIRMPVYFNPWHADDSNDGKGTVVRPPDVLYRWLDSGISRVSK